EFPRGNDIYLMITGPSHPFLSGAEIFHTPSLGDEEFEIPPISLDSDPSLAVSDVVDHFDDLADPSSSQNGSFSAQYGDPALV
uniref:TOX4 n=1 Tax=Macaca nemestrina TaxID=9545 RepID=A0A2K6CT51_MACNE